MLCGSILWQAHPCFWLLPFKHSSISGCRDGAAAGFLGSDADGLTPRNPEPALPPSDPAVETPPGWERGLESPHLSGPGKAVCRRERWPPVQPCAPSTATPARHPQGA